MIEDKTSYSTQNNILFSDISALLVVMQCPKIIQLKKKNNLRRGNHYFLNFSQPFGTHVYVYSDAT